ncbi:unnamed protein product [Pedinophyceae sp. YPF-701]|nr:unnamed protein product [Pedinophyceae sp. YPF-701]
MAESPLPDLHREVSRLTGSLKRLDPSSVEQQVRKLQAQVSDITQAVKAATQHVQQAAATQVPLPAPKRHTHASGAPRSAMSSEVSASNPYSRVMAMQTMGVVREFDRIRRMTVAVVGVGGVGSVAAEMLARCGIGRLVLFDYDRVELANMNRLFYRPDQVGLAKVDAARLTLGAINPDVAVDAHCINVATVRGHAALVGALSGQAENPPSKATPAIGTYAAAQRPRGRPVDLVLCCVDNYNARLAVNRACLQLGVDFLESGVSEDALSGHVQRVTPGRTACYECAPPLAVASGVDESTLRREGVCAASLPTTMGLVAALLAQAALKTLLSFGQVSDFVGYGAMKDHFSTMPVRPNPDCASELCRAAQQRAAEVPGGLAPAAAPAADAAPLHPDGNEWNIRVVAGDDDRDDEAPRAPGRAHAPGGLLAHPLTDRGSESEASGSKTGLDGNLADLLEELKALTD